MLISDFLARVAIYYRDSPKDQEIPPEGAFGMGLYYKPGTQLMKAVAAVDDWGAESFEDLLHAIAQEVRDETFPPETRH